MRNSADKRLDKWREETGPFATRPGELHGRFRRMLDDGVTWMVILSSGTGEHAMGWEHVSVSTNRRCPTWEEMDAVKRMFWGDDETVIQYHVPRADHRNLHPYCLHLWKPIGVDIPRPPKELVA